MANPLIIIPSRYAATRLPGKPLLDIGGAPMIVQVLKRAEEAHLGSIYVATDTDKIAEAVTAAGGNVVMTRTDHPSGSDRIFEALMAIDPDGSKHDIIVNLQGDMPTIEPEVIRQVVEPLLEDEAVDIATLAAPITNLKEADDPNVVKPILSFYNDTAARALYFTRAKAPSGLGAYYHHIGIYAYRRKSLERFVALEPSPLELREKLEQLRAIEAGMRIDVRIVDTVPLGVDTAELLEEARNAMSR